MREIISKQGPSTRQAGEERDCAVRAVAAAFGLSYDEAHAFAAKQWGRRPRGGTSTNAIVATMGRGTLLGRRLTSLKPINEYQTAKGLVKCQTQLGTFAKRHAQGTYFLLVRGHATVVKDGVILDGWRPGSRVNYIWRVDSQPM